LFLLGGFATTNRRLRYKAVFLDFREPYELIPKFKKDYEKELPAKNKPNRRFFSEKNPQCPTWSELLNAARTYFENSLSRFEGEG